MVLRVPEDAPALNPGKFLSLVMSRDTWPEPGQAAVS